jgi:hypothetical protein
MDKCQACDGKGLTDLGWPIIGCGACSICHGTGELPEFKVHILSAEVTLHDKPRYIAWTYKAPRISSCSMVEIVRANGDIERHRSGSIVWDGYKTARDNNNRFIAYRVIEQE